MQIYHYIFLYQALLLAWSPPPQDFPDILLKILFPLRPPAPNQRILQIQLTIKYYLLNYLVLALAFLEKAKLSVIESILYGKIF